ncbi:MAG: hypothetical protein ALAOOOJD_02697 [bacterium]|nr:hypothetical protein [bacterium]
MTKLKVVYVAGAGRSGSTVLDRVLGTLPGTVSTNELNRIWIDGFVDNKQCACGATFRECVFWRAVVAEAFGDSAPFDLTEMQKIWTAVDRSRHFLQLLFPLKSAAFKKSLTKHREVLQRLYFAIAKVSGAEVIVDSSKIPSGALILQGVPGLEVHVIHLVRDARACVYAWQKKKQNAKSGVGLRQYKPLRTIMFWAMRNAFAGLLARRLPYVRVRYEDLMKNPRQELQRLLDGLAPFAGKRLNFAADHAITLPEYHSISGNPDRFSNGVTTLRLDLEWMAKMNDKTRRLATVLTYPLLAQYGYTNGLYHQLHENASTPAK